MGIPHYVRTILSVMEKQQILHHHLNTDMENKEEYIIETSHVSFGFSKDQNVLSDVNLKIPKGAIYGF